MKWQEFRGPADEWPHDQKIPPAIDMELWVQQSWPVVIQWQGEKGGDGTARTVAPPGARTGSPELQHAPWLDK